MWVDVAPFGATFARLWRRRFPHLTKNWRHDELHRPFLRRRLKHAEVSYVFTLFPGTKNTTIRQKTYGTKELNTSPYFRRFPNRKNIRRKTAPYHPHFHRFPNLSSPPGAVPVPFLTFPGPRKQPSRPGVPDLVVADGGDEPHLPRRLDGARNLSLALSAEAGAVAAVDHPGVVDESSFVRPVRGFPGMWCQDHPLRWGEGPATTRRERPSGRASREKQNWPPKHGRGDVERDREGEVCLSVCLSVLCDARGG